MRIEQRDEAGGVQSRQAKLSFTVSAMSGSERLSWAIKLA
jgi:hypothetical protein